MYAEKFELLETKIRGSEGCVNGLQGNVCNSGMRLCRRCPVWPFQQPSLLHQRPKTVRPTVGRSWTTMKTKVSAS